MMTPPTDTTPEQDCPAILVVEIRQASGVRIAGRLEVSCYRGHHPTGTPHHGAADDTGELVKWRAEPLPEIPPPGLRTEDPGAAWQDGYTAGHSRAMRRMSDEPDVADAPNPYRPEPTPTPPEAAPKPARRPRKRAGT